MLSTSIYIPFFFVINLYVLLIMVKKIALNEKEYKQEIKKTTRKGGGKLGSINRVIERIIILNNINIKIMYIVFFYSIYIEFQINQTFIDI